MKIIPRFKAICIQKKIIQLSTSIINVFECAQKFRFWCVGADDLGYQDAALSCSTWCPIFWKFGWLSWAKLLFSIHGWMFSMIFAKIVQFGGWSPSQFGPHFVLITFFCGLRDPFDVRGFLHCWIYRWKSRMIVLGSSSENGLAFRVFLLGRFLWLSMKEN